MSKAPIVEYAVEPEQDPDIKQVWETIQRRRAIFIQVFLAVLAAGVIATVLSPPVYQTHAELLVPAGSNTVSMVDATNPISTMLAVAQPDTVSTQIRVLQSGPFLDDASREANVVRRPGVVPPSVKVQAVKDTNVIQLTVEGGDPEEITRLANKIVELHLDRTDLVRTTGLSDTLEFVRKQQQEAENKLKDATQKLLNFRTSHRLPQLEAEKDSRGKEYGELQSRVLEAETNVSSTKAQIARVKADLAKQPIDTRVRHKKENPQRAKLEDKLRDLKLQRVELLKDYLPDSDQVRDVDEQLAMYTEALHAEPESLEVPAYAANPRRETLEAKLSELETSLVKYEENYAAASAQFKVQNGQLALAGPWEVQLATLTEQRDRAQARYASLSDRLQDLEIRKNARAQIARIIETARVPSKPIQPRPAVNIALSMVLGVIAAIGAVFLREYLDDRINEPGDVERICAAPALGYVPLMPSNQPRVVSAMLGNSPVVEAYRALRSGIGFASLDAPIRRLQITSATKGEGKSTTAINLATAMAIDGKKVVLVDADLRRPSLHRILELGASPGLSEVLVGMKTLAEALRDTELENLRVVCAGAVPPNPAELLGTQTFERVIEELEASADVVIFDTPPCIPVTDPLIIASRMHGVVLVLHSGHTRKAAVKHAMELLERARARVIGVVFNQVEARKGSYYDLHYDGYYSETAERGDRLRRNGKTKSPTAEPVGALASLSNGEDDED
jgi:capsular exopolysaccharide synthesis family protein